MATGGKYRGQQTLGAEGQDGTGEPDISSITQQRSRISQLLEAQFRGQGGQSSGPVSEIPASSALTSRKNPPPHPPPKPPKVPQGNINASNPATEIQVSYCYPGAPPLPPTHSKASVSSFLPPITDTSSALPKPPSHPPPPLPSDTPTNSNIRGGQNTQAACDVIHQPISTIHAKNVPPPPPSKAGRPKYDQENQGRTPIQPHAERLGTFQVQPNDPSYNGEAAVSFKGGEATSEYSIPTPYQPTVISGVQQPSSTQEQSKLEQLQSMILQALATQDKPQALQSASANSNNALQAAFIPQQSTKMRLCENLVKCCTPIKKVGDIDIFQVPFKEVYQDQDLGVRVREIGNENTLEVEEKVVIIVGPTGSGKSTTINGIVNFLLGVRVDDKFRFKLILDSENSGKNQAFSQTSLVTSYKFNWYEGSPVPFTVTLVDTPGYGDTRGIDHDRKITNQIREFFSRSPPGGIDHVNAVGFVIQSGENRLTPTQKYIFESILSVFGRDMEHSIFLLVTFADQDEPPAIGAVRSGGIPFEDYFTFNNSALYSRPNAMVKMFWEMGAESVIKFFSSLEKTDSISLTMTQEVLQERRGIEIELKALQNQLRTGLDKLEQMRQVGFELKRHEDDLNANKEFLIKVKVHKIRKVDLGNPPRLLVTNCQQCENTCHKGCRRKAQVKGNTRSPYHCSAINWLGYCKACPKKCHYSKHQFDNFFYEAFLDEEARSSNDIKARFLGAEKSANQSKAILENHRAVFEGVLKKVVQLICVIRQRQARLQDIALRPSPLSIVEYIDLLIRTEQVNADPGWEERAAQLQKVRKEAEVLKGLGDQGFNPWESYKAQMIQQFGAERWNSIQKEIDETFPYDFD